ncbi:MAG: hypothetical protein GY791_12370 [Alphaproteobacteria bacterium]|nr:hypothetical protein [Alphaproteobacteria bacterium]
MQIQSNTAQRIAIVIEQNKSGSWSIAAYLVKADGKRERRSLGVVEDYGQAADTLEKVWAEITL